jgi:hypothetical protein
MKTISFLLLTSSLVYAQNVTDLGSVSTADPLAGTIMPGTVTGLDTPENPDNGTPLLAPGVPAAPGTVVPVDAGSVTPPPNASTSTTITPVATPGTVAPTTTAPVTTVPLTTTSAPPVASPVTVTAAPTPVVTMAATTAGTPAASDAQSASASDAASSASTGGEGETDDAGVTSSAGGTDGEDGGDGTDGTDSTGGDGTRGVTTSGVMGFSAGVGSVIFAVSAFFLI